MFTIEGQGVINNPFLEPISPYTTEEQLLIAIESLKELAEAAHTPESIAEMLRTTNEVIGCLVALE